MNGIIDGFPTISFSDDYTEKDIICHSLIEGTAFRTYSFNYFISMLNKLKQYYDKKGEDFVIDTLFMKYLKALVKNSDQQMTNILNGVALNFTKKEINSQYHVAFIYEFDINDNRKYRETIAALVKNPHPNKKISIKGNKISNTILFYLLNKSFSFLIKEDLAFSNTKIEGIDKRNIVQYYENVMTNINAFYSIQFWTDVVVYEVMKDFTIDVKDNPFLFNAAVCLMYLNPMIKIKIDIKNFKFPEFVNSEINHLMKYQIPLKNLLEMKSSIEIKNLCNLVYLLVLNQAPLNELMKFKDSMSKNSLIILLYIYINYTNESIKDEIIKYLIDQINIKDQNDFIYFRALFMYKQYFKNIKSIPNDILYILSPKTNIDILNDEIYTLKSFYGFIKRKIIKGDHVRKNKEKVIQNNQNDFKRFIQNVLTLFTGIMNYRIYAAYMIDYEDVTSVGTLLTKSLKNNLFEESLALLLNSTYILEIKEILIANFEKFKELIKNIKEAVQIVNKYGLKNEFNIKEKLELYMDKEIYESSICVSRSDILMESISLFENIKMKNRRIIVSFKKEKGIDAGGLSREWYCIVSEKLIESNVFKPVPNGTSLTINSMNDNDRILKFTGKLIGSAFINRRNINLKLASFIWKKLLDEEITLNDMMDYDEEIYNSLKWIEENDPAPMMATFTDMNEEELCENGKNIELTNDNKKEYIKLMIEKTLMKNCGKSIDQIVEGFREIINIERINLFNFSDMRDIVNGKDSIDINDWKQNALHNDKKYFDMFFDVISSWPEEKQRKLLKFVTGSQSVPIYGFGYYKSLGRSFKLTFNSNSEKLPISHTCYNELVIPRYDSKAKFDQKLTWAIEGEEFGFS